MVVVLSLRVVGVAAAASGKRMSGPGENQATLACAEEPDVPPNGATLKLLRRCCV
jgi:hypothetical protein